MVDNMRGTRSRFGIERQVVAFSTADSWARVPHVSYLYEADAGPLLAYHRELSERLRAGGGPPAKVTLNTLLMKIVAEGLVAAPLLNSHLKYSSFSATGRLIRRPHVDITIPWLLPDGKVISVVVPRVEGQSVGELQLSVDGLEKRIGASDIRELLGKTAQSDTLRRLGAGDAVGLRRVLALLLRLNRLSLLKGAERRRYYSSPAAGRLSPEDVDGGSVVVSNIGSLRKGLRGEFALLDVIAPMVFAVGIGAAQEKPAVILDEAGVKKIGIKTIIPLCLAFDHRACEFAALLPFIDRVEELFAEPRLLEREP